MAAIVYLPDLSVVTFFLDKLNNADSLREKWYT